jgi:DNA-binding response OmpR family regulator
MAKILIVEDDDDWSSVLRVYLEEEHHLVDVVSKGLEAVPRLFLHGYDLLILDWMLPDISGVEVCRQFREKAGTTPVLMLTGRSSVNDKIVGLDAGADDYLIKPTDPMELVARVRALIRRTDSIVGKVLKVQDLELNTATRSLSRNSTTIELRPKEYMLLELLMRYPNKCFTTEGLVQRLWSSDASASVDTVRTHIKMLRRKIGDSDTNPIIRTTRGFGYRIIGD